jgi:predicted N-formylglutamate amidohydrolase
MHRPFYNGDTYFNGFGRQWTEGVRQVLSQLPNLDWVGAQRMHAEDKAMDAKTNNWGSHNLVITCEHGGNRIPGRYRSLFKDNQFLLESHRGFDPGALSMAEDLAAALGAPLVTSTVSRLLVDLNRSVGHPRLSTQTIRTQPSEVKASILKQYYHPYRDEAERLVRQVVNDHGQVIHLSSHSFTPELDGKFRNADIGLLYDPVRLNEAALCEQWKSALNLLVPELIVRRNYPYSGKDDGLTSWFRKQFTSDNYIGIELEINQKHIVNKSQQWAVLRIIIISTLRMVLCKPTVRIAL